jgi:hypothetical protein
LPRSLCCYKYIAYILDNFIQYVHGLNIRIPNSDVFVFKKLIILFKFMETISMKIITT